MVRSDALGSSLRGTPRLLTSQPSLLLKALQDAPAQAALSAGRGELGEARESCQHGEQRRGRWFRIGNWRQETLRNPKLTTEITNCPSSARVPCRE